MTVRHWLCKLLRLDDNLEPAEDDPADEELAIPDDLVETLDLFPPSVITHHDDLLGFLPNTERVHDNEYSSSASEETIAINSVPTMNVTMRRRRGPRSRSRIVKPSGAEAGSGMHSGRTMWSMKLPVMDEHSLQIVEPRPEIIVDSSQTAKTNRRAGGRKCMHCSTTDTPQWRGGPEGPGTLCNACGIRYKSNRLLPEYRPTTSPDFKQNKHSNRHKYIIDMRERTAQQ
ncbi:GATA transcription factor 7-like [Typha latifolia]|uniref:GATA transcription factor 7-like n=1 Tax=Typha latifolia TaxID=4733 RepID=UPI003C30B871